MKAVKNKARFLLVAMVSILSFGQLKAQWCNYLDYLRPSNSDPKLFVKVRVIIFHPSIGQGVWYGTTSSDVQNMIDAANSTYSNVPAPNLPITGVTSITDSKIQFSVCAVYNFTDDVSYDDVREAVSATATASSYDPNYLNVFLGGKNGGLVNVATSSYTDPITSEISTYIHFIAPTPQNLSSWAYAFAHEAGHSLGLNHTSTADGIQTLPLTRCTLSSQISDVNIISPSAGITCTPGVDNNLMHAQAGCEEYLSPLQMAYMHYMLKTKRLPWLTSVSYFDATTAMSVHDYTVSGPGETWNTPRFQKGNVIVPSGSFLTISCEIHMQNKGKIIVKPGGRLWITGAGEVTNISGRLWEGIDVMGVYNQTQSYNAISGFSSYQGVLAIDNGGRLSNSINAVRNYGYMSNGTTISYGNSGGIVIADNADFLNNVRDVEFLAYPINVSSISKFTNCNFIADGGPIGDGNGPYVHVTLWNIKGVKFQGCTFQNAISYSVSGEGIHSADAIYEISNSNTRSNLFKNLDKGVSVYNPNRLRPITIVDGQFNNNRFGIIMSSADGSYFGRNTFTLTGATYGSAQYGIYLNDCKNYTANSNTLTSTSQLYSHGIYASYSGNGAHKIFRNSFDNLHSAIVPQYDNSGLSNPTDGLKMNCNVFNNGTSNLVDIAMLGINGANSSNIPSVATWQGSSGASLMRVRNQYGASCSGSSTQNKWLINVAQKVVRHPANISPAAMQPTPQPSCSNSMVQITSGPAFVFATHCLYSEGNPSGSPISASDLASSISSARASLISLNEAWNETIDNGNTETLYGQIIDSGSSQSAKESLLLTASPYVSDNILQSFFSNESTSVSQILNVVLANAPVSANVWQTILDLELDEATMDALTTYQNENLESERDILESQLVLAKNEMQIIYAEKLRYFMSDTLETAIDSVISVLSANDLVEVPLAKVKLAQAYLDGGHTDRAFSYADSLKLISGYGDIMDVQIKLMKLDTSSKKLVQLREDETTRTFFANQALDSTKAGSWQARAVMNYLYNDDMKFTFLVPDISGERNSNQIEQNSVNEDLQVLSNDSKLFNLFPNPGNNIIFLTRNSVLKGANKAIILNLLGQVVLETTVDKTDTQEINISSLNNGLYFVNLYQWEHLVAGKKFIVSR